MRRRVDKFKFYDLVIYAARASHAARHLATSLSCRRWRDDLPERYERRRPYFRGNPSPVVVNWGSTVRADWLDDARFRIKPVWLNSPETVSRAIDKREFFAAFDNTQIPVLKWTTDKARAQKWWDKGHGVVARKVVDGSSGRGIIICGQAADGRPERALVDAPLYTRYFPKSHEFRVHVFKGQAIDITQKKLSGGPNVTANRDIRSLNNGWIHAHTALSVGDGARATMEKAAINAVDHLGLDFGAVDILATLSPLGDTMLSGGGRDLKGFVICEVNTGPGLENTQTIQAYSNAILNFKKGV